MNLVRLLHTVQEHYHFHVYHRTPTPYGYILETNCGTKRASIWQEKRDVNWEFLWREEVAKRGLRTIDRFIRTRDGSPYVQISEAHHVVIQDLLKGRPINTNDHQHLHHLGAYIGAVYRTVMDHDDKQQNPWTRKNDQKIQSIDLRKGKEWLKLRKQIVTYPDSLFMNLVKQQWKMIEDRWKKAIWLFQEDHTFKGLPQFEIRHFSINPYNRIQFQVEQQSSVKGFYGFVHFVSHLVHTEKNITLEELKVIYEAFEKQLRIEKGVLQQVLAEFVFPYPFLHVIDLFFQRSYSDQDCIQMWMQLCDKQELLDQYYQWLATKMDHFGEDAVSL